MKKEEQNNYSSALQTIQDLKEKWGSLSRVILGCL